MDFIDLYRFRLTRLHRTKANVPFKFNCSLKKQLLDTSNPPISANRLVKDKFF